MDGDGRVDRQNHAKDIADVWDRHDFDFASVLPDDGIRKGQADSETVAGSAPVNPVKGFEDAFHFMRRNSFSPVFNVNLHR